MLKRPHVVKPIGQLDEDDTDVVDHGQQHLAEVLGLALLARGELNRADLRDALDDMGDFRAEQLGNTLRRGEGVFNDVVKQTGGDCHDVQFHVGEEIGDFERMNQVWFAGMADLSLVLEGREHVGAAQQLEVGLGAVASDLLQQRLETNHGTRCLTP